MIQAIPTVFHGVTFRSRLEARWAAFFNALGSTGDKQDLRWSYEPEGFQLSSGWYLPDFQLYPSGLYVEIKPWDFDRSALDKTLELMRSGRSIILLAGEPRIDGYKAFAWMDFGGPDDPDLTIVEGELAQCRKCDSIAFWSHGWCAWEYKHDCDKPDHDRPPMSGTYWLTQAHEKAMAERFGERGSR